MSEIKHKVGKDVYAPRGLPVTTENVFVIVGAPGVRGERWVSIAPLVGGPVSSMSEGEFDRRFRRVD